MKRLTPPQALIVLEHRVQSIRDKFGRDAIRTDYGHGYYLPPGWERR